MSWGFLFSGWRERYPLLNIIITIQPPLVAILGICEYN